jgi:hypothetical protein
MQQIAKHFSEQLNKSLDNLEVPTNRRERTAILSKMMHIPKPQALSLIEGHQLPDEQLLQALAAELEVEVKWLLGKK